MSTFFNEILYGTFDQSSPTLYRIVVNGTEIYMGHFLEDRIYPSWVIFSKPIPTKSDWDEVRYSRK